MNPQRVRSAEFRTVKTGLDPDEVQSFLNAVAAELERAQNQSTAMEARARAAVARLQELADDAGSQSDASAEIRQSDRGGRGEPDCGHRIGRSSPKPSVARCYSPNAPPTPQWPKLGPRRNVSEPKLRLRPHSRSVRPARLPHRLLAEAASRSSQGRRRRTYGDGRARSTPLLARRDFLESDVDHLERNSLPTSAPDCAKPPVSSSTSPSASPVVWEMSVVRWCRLQTRMSQRR